MTEREASRARSVDLYGVTLLKSGDEAGARRCFSHAQAVIESAYGPLSPHLAMIFSHQGDVLRLYARDPAGARLRYLRALAILQHAHGLAHPSAIEVMVNIGYTLVAEKKRADAAIWFERAAAVGRSVRDRESPVLIIPDLLRSSSVHWMKPVAYREALERETTRLTQIYGSETAPVRDAQQYLRDYVDGAKRYEDMYDVRPAVELFLPAIAFALAVGYIAWTLNGSVSPVRSALLPFVIGGEAIIWLFAIFRLWVLWRGRRGRPLAHAHTPEQELAKFDSMQSDCLGFELSPFRRSARGGDTFAQLAVADIHLMAERYAKATEMLTRILSDQPGQPSILCRRALAYLGAEQPELLEPAISDLMAATAQEPAGRFAHVLLSMALNELDRSEEAVAAAGRALELDDECAEAWYERGVGYATAGDYEAATADLTRALALGTQPRPAHIYRGYARLELGQVQEALEDLTLALDPDPDNAPVLVLRGTAYRKAAQHEMSVADLNRAIEIDPQDLQAYRERCQTYRAMGQMAAALADISKAIDLCGAEAAEDPDSADLRADLRAERRAIWHELRLTAPQEEERHLDMRTSATAAQEAARRIPAEED